ncbi:polysaccharide biosynthesis protein, partial [Alphaproteobacteria bacterium]|nr:polysaccharide biosynthesis protein [Alphaproteobacteria bacterium]
LAQTKIGTIRIFSRDEKKQNDMRQYFQLNNLEFYIGDVRDYASVLNAVRGVDYIFHAAALKQVPSCEFFPLEAVKTNVIGTENVLEAAISCEVKKVICLSTDKAVYPINAMGISKAMMEKIIIAKSRISSNTDICITRYGNVMASRGSVIPLFVDQILNNVPITITDPRMSRFMMSLEDAVELVSFAFENGKTGDIFVQKSPATTIENLAIAVKELLDKREHPINTIGTRHGEKLFEVLLSREELIKADDLGKYYKVSSDDRNLNYKKYYNQGEPTISDALEYTSHNTTQLDVNKTKKLLTKIDLFKK